MMLVRTLLSPYFFLYHNTQVSILLAVEGEIDKVPLKTWMKIEKIVKEDPTVLDAATFDDIDALAGVFSFIMREVVEYRGVLQGKNNTNKALKYNNQKLEHLNQKQNKLINILSKYNIAIQ